VEAPSLVMAPVFDYIYLTVIHYKCVRYNLLQNNILFEGKVDNIYFMWNNQIKNIINYVQIILNNI